MRLRASPSLLTRFPRIPGQPSIQNKFIVSAGWDKRIYVWMDSGAPSGAMSVQGYSLRMPKDGETKGHDGDNVHSACAAISYCVC